ncbi:hypothetical protein KP1_19 [Klebsiella virus 2019KP1]|nr:hypothetical protein KP1_19 [Klebsiella virus 2019KP1]
MAIPLDTQNSLEAAAIETQDVDITEIPRRAVRKRTYCCRSGEYYGYFTEYVEIGKRLPTKVVSLQVSQQWLTYVSALYCTALTAKRSVSASFPIAISNFERAGFKKFFDKLNYDNSIKQAAQRLGQAFTFPDSSAHQCRGQEVKHRGPVRYPPDSEVRPEHRRAYQDASPGCLRDYAVPLEQPNQRDTGKALHIEGTFDDGKSKNWIQEDIYKAEDFPGSALDIILNAGSVPSPAAIQAPAAPAAPATLLLRQHRQHRLRQWLPWLLYRQRHLLHRKPNKPKPKL